MTATTAARVEVLTAEVHVLQVGSRQVTLSVYSQLDTVPFDMIEPFGRVRPRDTSSYEIQVVGRSDAGNLVRSWLPEIIAWPKDDGCKIKPSWRANWARLHSEGNELDVWKFLPRVRDRESEAVAAVLAWRDLPLIVLAGLR
jgi:hypothetical protein